MDDVGGLDETGKAKARRPGLPVDPHRVKRALFAGRFWLLGAAIFGISFGFFWAKVVMSRFYESVAVLRYEGELDLEALGRPTGYALGPAAEVLSRESVLRKLREKTGWAGSLASLELAIDYNVDFRAGTLEIVASGETPASATQLVGEVVDVFLDYHKERQARRIEQEIARIADRIQGAEQEAEEARSRYNEFRERHGIANLSTEQDSMVTSAATLRADSELTGSEVRALEAEVASLESQLQSIPKTSPVSGGVSPERAAYDQLRQELASARASLSDDHPRVQALKLQVDELRGQLRAPGAGSSFVGNNTTYTTVSEELREARSRLTTLRERQKGLAKLADRAQDRVESFSGIEGEISTLLAEVQINESLVSKLRADQAALEDALEYPPSGFSVLDPGSLPEYAVRNRMKPIAFLLISALSILIALGVVLWREFRGLRVLTPTEVAFWGDGPVLGAASWPNEETGLDELVAALDDLAPEATGTVLILGGSSADEPLARTLARRMNQDWFMDSASGDRRPAQPPLRTGPLTTPPPSGPYPVGGAARQAASGAASGPAAQPSTALALQPVKLVKRDHHLSMEAWEGPFEGQALRRAARLADRVMVLVRSGAMSATELNSVKRRIGRDDRVGYVVVDLSNELHALPDRVGDVRRFWAG